MRATVHSIRKAGKEVLRRCLLCKEEQNMTHEQLQSELRYNLVMTEARRWLKKALISEEDYWKINTKMKACFLPVSDGLISENCLLSTSGRGNIT